MTPCGYCGSVWLSPKLYSTVTVAFPSLPPPTLSSALRLPLAQAPGTNSRVIAKIAKAAITLRDVLRCMVTTSLQEYSRGQGRGSSNQIRTSGLDYNTKTFPEKPPKSRHFCHSPQAAGRL